MLLVVCVVVLLVLLRLLWFCVRFSWLMRVKCLFSGSVLWLVSS